MKVSRSLLIVAVVAVLAASAGALALVNLSPAPQGSPQVVKGVSFTLPADPSMNLTKFLQKAAGAGSVVTWAGDWSELALPSGAPAVLAALGPTYGLKPVVIAQLFDQSTGLLLRPLDNSTFHSYVDSAVAFARQHSPDYMGFGIEVNILYEKSPSDFARFVQLFDATHSAVKAASPKTQVFTVYQLERMKGLQGGLFGGTNDPSRSEWSLLAQVNADVLAFTTYPSLVFHAPSEMPLDYYSEIASHTTKPIAFTEIGWHSGPTPAGWGSNESSEAAFVDTFFSLTHGLKVKLAVWSFLFDLPTGVPFSSMGLYKAGGAPKQAASEWSKFP